MAFSRSVLRNAVRAAVRAHPHATAHGQRNGVSAYCMRWSSSAAAGPLKILYGSQTGTAMAFASQLGETASSQLGLDTQVTDLYEYNPAELTAATPQKVIFVTSCFGKGEPTDSAKTFFKWIMDPARKPGELSNISFAVFGLGSSATHKEHYNVIGKKLDARLEQLGAKRFCPRGEGDDSDCIEMDFEKWQEEVLTKLRAENPSAAGESVATEDAAAKPVIGRVNPYHSEDSAVMIVPMETPCTMSTSQPTTEPQANPRRSALAKATLLRKENLTPSDFRPIYELHFDAADSRLQYTTGDHVAMLPSNPAERVERLCERLRWDPEMRITLVDRAAAAGRAPSVKLPTTDCVTIRDLLRNDIDLGAALSPHMLRVLAASAPDAPTRDALLGMTAKDMFLSRVRGQYLQLEHVLSKFPGLQLPLDRLIAAWPTITPRFYSISSSHKEQAGRMVATFRHLRVPRDDGSVFDGLCSTYMAKLQPGDEVSMSVRSSSFRLPEDPSTSIVMVAGGIGIAPFRAFLMDRMIDKRTKGAKFGRATLLYGCRDSSDRVYADLTAEAIREGVLTESDVAFAAPSKSTLAITSGPRLAHDLIREHSPAVWETINSGGSIYVCGGAAGFGQSVVKAVKGVLQAHGGMTVEQADTHMSVLVEGCKYVEDLAD